MASSSEDGLKDLQQLLQIQNLDIAVRVGDVFSMIIEFQANKQRWKQVSNRQSIDCVIQETNECTFCFFSTFASQNQAYAAVQEMKEFIPESSIQYYVNPKLLAVIYKEMNVEFNPRKSQSRPTPDDSAYNEIRDDIEYGTNED